MCPFVGDAITLVIVYDYAPGAYSGQRDSVSAAGAGSSRSGLQRRPTVAAGEWRISGFERNVLAVRVGFGRWRRIENRHVIDSATCRMRSIRWNCEKLGRIRYARYPDRSIVWARRVL